MENKILDVPTLSEIQETYQYIEHKTHDNFSSLKKPIFTKEGHVIEKSTHELNRGISMFTRLPIESFDSSDLPKIESDFIKIETAYDKLHSTFSLAAYMGTQREKEQEKKIDLLSTRLESLMTKMEVQTTEWDKTRKNNDLTVSNLTSEISELKKTNASQSQEIKNLIDVIKDKEKNIEDLKEEKKLMLEQIDNKEIDNRELRRANTRLEETIEEQAAEIRQLKSVRANDAMEIEVMEEIELKPKPLEEPALPDDGMGRARNFSIGLGYTRCESNFPIRKIQNDLRKYAYDDDKRNLKLLLNNGNKEAIINGRGAPDSLGSMFRFWHDKTPLMLATKQGNISCVKALLKRGAKVNYLDRDCKTALDYVGNHDNSDEIYNILRGYGAEKGIYFKKIFKLIEDQDERELNRNEEMINSFQMI